jgi:LDH2 family malate/lactate/ureidoglycolate dehydrogenase
MTIKLPELRELVHKILLTEYAADHAEMIADVLLFGELSGRPSHGLLRLLRENFGVFVEGTVGTPEYIHKTKVSTLIDAKGNAGMLIGPLAMREVIRLGKENGIGIVGTKGSVNTTGAVSYYCEAIAKENLISIIFTHSSLFMAPFTSKKALFGTNPISFGIPAKPLPIIFDMSTAAITFGEVAHHKAAGKPLPPDVAIDSTGEVTSDAAKAMEGALLAFGNSYKGSGLAMMVEILGALWTGANFEGENTQGGWGNLFMAFSPELLSDMESFKEKTAKFIHTLRNAETRDGKPIRIPGENSLLTRDANMEKGEIEIPDKLYKQLHTLSST